MKGVKGVVTMLSLKVKVRISDGFYLDSDPLDPFLSEEFGLVSLPPIPFLLQPRVDLRICRPGPDRVAQHVRARVVLPLALVTERALLPHPLVHVALERPVL